MTRSKRKAKPKVGTCAYCGAHGEVTKDHVPPDGIFASPQPSNLITVPACKPCHEPWSKDDEYFKIRLCLNNKARGHPDVNRNLKSIFDALNRPEASGLKQALLDDWRNVEVRSKGGVILGHTAAFQVDMDRICRVVERTVRGLFFYEKKEPLPTDHGVKVISNEMLCEQDAEVIEEMTRTIIEPLAANPPTIIGENTFSYRVCFSHVPSVSAWGLVFYGNVQFIALTGPNDTRDTVAS